MASVLIIFETLKLYKPLLNDWVEVAQRKVSANEFHSGIVRGEKEDRVGSKSAVNWSSQRKETKRDWFSRVREPSA